MAAKLQQLERQRGEVERSRDELKVLLRVWPVGCWLLAFCCWLLAGLRGRTCVLPLLQAWQGELAAQQGELAVQGPAPRGQSCAAPAVPCR